jgi:hypothetical protein
VHQVKGLLLVFNRVIEPNEAVNYCACTIYEQCGINSVYVVYNMRIDTTEQRGVSATVYIYYMLLVYDSRAHTKNVQLIHVCDVDSDTCEHRVSMLAMC